MFLFSRTQRCPGHSFAAPLAGMRPPLMLHLSLCFRCPCFRFLRVLSFQFYTSCADLRSYNVRDIRAERCTKRQMTSLLKYVKGSMIWRHVLLCNHSVFTDFFSLPSSSSRSFTYHVFLLPRIYN